MIDVAQRRARLEHRHLLSRSGHTPTGVAGTLVGLHSSDPATVFLSLRARIEGFAPQDLERDLYDTRSLVRMLGMRRTMFVVPRDLAAVMNAACTRDLAAPQRTRLLGLIGRNDLGGERWLRSLESRIVEALESLGPSTAAELTEHVPELGQKVRAGTGNNPDATFGLSTRILFQLATEGRIIRGRPRGTWRSSLYEWDTVESWLGAPLPELETADAATELARRWLSTFGPGTMNDLKWWTGWTVRRTLDSLQALGASEVGLGDTLGFVAPDDHADAGTEPDVASFLPSLDPSIMGWKERDWYLGDHAGRLFDRNGNAGPTIVWHGRVVGGWAQRPDGEILFRLLEDIGSDGTGAVEQEARRLETWMSGIAVVPRFRTPLEQELLR